MRRVQHHHGIPLDHLHPPGQLQPRRHAHHPLGVERAEHSLRRGQRDREVPAQVRRLHGQLDHRREVAHRHHRGIALGWRPARASASTSGASGPITRVEWSRSTASFSAAISSSVSPRYSVCSRPTEVSTVTCDGSTLVASRRPPSPASITADVDAGRRQRDERGRGVGLELGHGLALVERAVRRPRPPARPARRRRRTRHRRSRLRRSGSARASARRAGTGRRRRDLPCASSSAAVISVTDDLPFVPTTWIEAKRCCGIPSTETSRRIRSSPKRIPSGVSEPSQASPCSALQARGYPSSSSSAR